MKHYTKPELKINRFETNDVISTSCTCPEECWHLNVAGIDASHGSYFAKGALIFFEETGVCPEHGSIYSLKKD